MLRGFLLSSSLTNHNALFRKDPSDLGWRPCVKAWLSKLKDEEKVENTIFNLLEAKNKIESYL